MSLFSLRKRKQEEERKEAKAQEKRFAEENKKSGEEIAAALRTASSQANGGNGEERSRMFSNYSQTLAKKISNSRTCGYCDLSELDSQLLKVVVEYGDALSYGDVECAERAVVLINDIIDERAKLADCSKNNAKIEADKVKELAWNDNRLMIFYNHLRTAEENVRNFTSRHNEAKRDYEEQRAIAKSMQNANPAAWQLLKTNIPGQTQLSPAAVSLRNQLQTVKSCLNNVKFAKVGKEQNQKYATITKQWITKLEMALSQKNCQLAQAEIDDATNTMREFAGNMAEMGKQIGIMQDLSDEITDLLDAVTNNPDDDIRGIRAVQTYDEILKEEEMQKAERRLVQEQKTEQKNDQRIEN